MESNGKQHIAKTAGICGGKACIAGHRIRVMDIVVCHERTGDGRGRNRSTVSWHLSG